MASLHCTLLVLPVAKLPNPNRIQSKPINICYPKPFLLPISASRSLKARLRSSPSSSASTSKEQEQQQSDVEAVTIDNLRRFVDLNVGKWTGSFHQFDTNGKLLQKVCTKLSAITYGDDENISLIQTLYIKQPALDTYDEEPEWAEYKVKETNMFTVDTYQQIGFFPNEKAFALRYQNTGMLEYILRQGVLGEDDTGEESPKNLNLPSRRPSLVCESCLYSQIKDLRARVFHIMNPKGVLEMLLIFLEERGNGMVSHPSLDNTVDDASRITPFLGNWKSHSITKRSSIYGATVDEADATVLLEMDDNGQIIQDINTTLKGSDVTTNVHRTGTMSENLIKFDGGYRITLLPVGKYMGYPSDVGKYITEFNTFQLEFCWLEGSGKRQRLVRTLDEEGTAVTTYFSETKI